MTKDKDQQLREDVPIDRLALLVVTCDLARQVEQLCDIAGSVAAKRGMVDILHLLDRDRDSCLAMHAAFANMVNESTAAPR